MSAAPQALIQHIATLARQGRLDQAASEAAAAFAASPQDPVLAALAGAIECHRGQFGRAIAYLETAHRAHPEDMTVRANFADALFQSGQGEAALALCTEAAMAADKSLRLMRLAAHLHQLGEAHKEAVALYRQITQKDPQDWISWNNLGNALDALEDYAGAAEALRKAASLAPDSRPTHYNLGTALVAAQQFEEGEQVLKSAADRFAEDAKPLVALYTLYRNQGREDEAYAAISEAAKRAPKDAIIQCDHGQEAASQNAYDTAEVAFEAALALDPALSPAYVGLASVYERINQEDRLDSLYARGQAQGCDAASLSYIDALRLKRANKFEEAFAALEAAGDVVVERRKMHLRGVMLDRLGQHDAAFAAFTQMNDHWKTDPTQPQERARLYRHMIVECTDKISPAWLQSWTGFSTPLARPTPVFLVGFPRSGTTLLDTMLMAAPNTVVLEEEPFIAQIERDLGGFDALPQLSEAQLCQARDRYFEEVRSLGPLADDALVVDKQPLHLNKVPAIKRLFPDARFILALRHPCDVLLSCFITNFRANHGMANFLDLEDAAQLYDSTFTYWQKSVALFDAPVHTVVYERLVEDKTRELRPLFDWLDLPWPGDDHDHRTAARARGVVSTASYAQVTEPIYTRAAGRWHRYIEHLRPIFPIIQPWVERFGYSLEDGRIPDWPTT